MRACVPSRFRHVWLCDSMDCSPLGSSVLGILHALLQGIFPAQVAWISCIGRWALYH